MTGKVSVGLASHAPCVTDVSGLSGSRTKEGRSAPRYIPVWAPFSGGSRGCHGCPDTHLLIRVHFLKKNICSKHIVNAVTVSVNISGNVQKTHNFDIRNTKIFWEGHNPLPKPHPPRRLRLSTSVAPFRWIGQWTPALVKS